MRFEALLDAFAHLAWFDYPSALLLFPEGEAAVRTALYRFKKVGSLVELRRGMYAFSERYRKAPIVAPALAGALYAPSYLSERWALSWYGVIPEKVTIYTSVSSRPTASFENPLGHFSYRFLKQDLFWGHHSEKIMGSVARIASPEKALLDFMHLEGDEWKAERFEAYRVEARVLDSIFLLTLAERAGSPRLKRGARAFDKYKRASEEGGIEL